jgi:hypothetical protein
MSKLSIQPKTVLLTSGQSATFEVFAEADDTGTAAVKSAADDTSLADVTWELSPTDGGALFPVNGTSGATAVYVAPVVTAAKTVAIIAKTTKGSLTATVNLTPNEITILPSHAELSTNKSQEFRAIVAGSPAPALTWLLSPPIGTLEPRADTTSCVYKPDLETTDSTVVSVMASSATSALPATATLKLSSPPWTGPGVQWLGAFLLLVFWLVVPLIGLWPPALPSPEVARLARIEAAQELADQTNALQFAEVGVADANERLQRAQKDAPPTNPPAPTAPSVAKAPAPPPRTPAPPTAAAPQPAPSASAAPSASPAASASAAPHPVPQAAPDEPKSVAAIKLNMAEDTLDRVSVARQTALAELAARRLIERQANDPNVKTWLFGTMNRELDLLLLVLVAGGVGAFLHVAQSFSMFVGDRKIRAQWVWWYACHPFIGAALALVFYGSVRGGFMAMATGNNAKAADLNAFGLVSVAALVGMFSRAATVKLGEVFDTIFKSSALKSKDALGTADPPKPPPPPAPAPVTPKAENA